MAASLRHAFEQTLHDFQPAVVLSSWIYPDSCAALHLARGRVPVVAIAQGSDIHQYLNMPLRRRIILKDLPGAKAVITRSRELSRILESTGFPSGKLHTVYNGVSLETFRPRPALASRKPGRVILFVGNFYPVKNPLLLIQAVAQTESTLLIMAGAGPLEQSARDLASRLGIPSRVVFAGRKTPLEIAELMNGADILAVTSTNEGVPNVILEAFASSLPAVASNVGGIPEVLDQPFLGRMFPSEDLPALVTAINEQLAAPRDSAAIRRHAERFSWEASASAYREILMDLLQ
jgi:glycosyltransferase involved in cell wall biosynthesis